MGNNKTEEKVAFCIMKEPDYSGVTIVEITPDQKISNYGEARKLADKEAKKHMEDSMLLSWYDRDRDYESPQHTTECHQDSAIPGYVDYGLNRGATLKVDIEKGRFVFFYVPVKL